MNKLELRAEAFLKLCRTFWPSFDPSDEHHDSSGEEDAAERLKSNNVQQFVTVSGGADFVSFYHADSIQQAVDECAKRLTDQDIGTWVEAPTHIIDLDTGNRFKLGFNVMAIKS